MCLFWQKVDFSTEGFSRSSCLEAILNIRYHVGRHEFGFQRISKLGKNMKVLLLTLMAILSVLGADQAVAKKGSCYCNVSINDLTNKTPRSGVIKSYGTLADYKVYVGYNHGIRSETISPRDREDCRSKCSGVASGDTGSPELAKAACASGAGNGATIRAYAALEGEYNKPVQTIGVLKRTNPVYSCPNGGKYQGDSIFSGGGCQISKKETVTCPEGYWLEDHKSPAKCVKQACAPGSMPGVPAWAGIGGNVDGGNYLTDDKGGSRFVINAKSGCEPGYRKVGNKWCVMEYQAKLEKPGSCSF